MVKRQTLLGSLLLSVALFSAGSFAEQAKVSAQPVGKGLYELAYNAGDKALWVAGSGSRDQPGGVVYRLDPQTLAVKSTIDNAHKPFGVALSPDGSLLYLGNSREGAVTAIETTSGRQRAFQVLDGRQRSETVKPLQVRELIADGSTGRLYVPGVGADSVLWVLDAHTLKLLNTIKGTGKIATGLALDSKNHRLYLSNADGELVVIDTGTDKIVKRVSLGVTGDSALLNITLDQAGQRLFISNYKQAGVLVVDTRTDKLVTRIAVPASLAVLFNPQRQQLYVTHRQAGTVSIIDANSYKVEQTVTAPGLPNSLALSADGNSLYVTVKQPASRDKPATADDQVMRISL